MNESLSRGGNLIDIIDVGSRSPETVFTTAPGGDFSDFNQVPAHGSGVQVCINKAVRCTFPVIMSPIPSTVQNINTDLTDNVQDTKAGYNLVQINTYKYD